MTQIRVNVLTQWQKTKNNIQNKFQGFPGLVLEFSLNFRVSQDFPGFKRNSRVFQDTGNPEMTPLQHCESSKTEIILIMT